MIGLAFIIYNLIVLLSVAIELNGLGASFIDYYGYGQKYRHLVDKYYMYHFYGLFTFSFFWMAFRGIFFVIFNGLFLDRHPNENNNNYLDKLNLNQASGRAFFWQYSGYY